MRRHRADRDAARLLFLAFVLTPTSLLSGSAECGSDAGQELAHPSAHRGSGCSTCSAASCRQWKPEWIEAEAYAEKRETGKAAEGDRMSIRPCWRCQSTGFLAPLPNGDPLPCRLCAGSGVLPDQQPFGLRVGPPKLSGLDRVRKALAGFWDKHISHLYDGPGEI